MRNSRPHGPHDAIDTDRLLIEPFCAVHLSERYVSWLNDPRCTRYSELRHKVHTIDSCREYFLSFRDSQNSFWAIMAKNERFGHIGNMTAIIDGTNQVADLSILIGEERSWGDGYGAEAWRAACDYLLNTANLRKVTAGTMALNEPMLGVFRKTGMEIEGVRRQQFLLDGNEVDFILAARFLDR